MSGISWLRTVRRVPKTPNRPICAFLGLAPRPWARIALPRAPCAESSYPSPSRSFPLRSPLLHFCPVLSLPVRAPSFSARFATDPLPRIFLGHAVVRSNGHLVVTDFGLAHEGKTGAPSSNAKSVVGTPHFIAPEILFCQTHDRMVDYWALVRTAVTHGLCFAFVFVRTVPLFLYPAAQMLCGPRADFDFTTHALCPVLSSTFPTRCLLHTIVYLCFYVKGVMMYVMFTGDYPFGDGGSSKTDVFTSIGEGSVSLSGHQHEISDSAEKCIFHLLQRQPEQRLGRGGISQVR